MMVFLISERRTIIHAGDFCRHIFSESQYSYYMPLVSILTAGALSCQSIIVTDVCFRCMRRVTDVCFLVQGDHQNL